MSDKKSVRLARQLRASWRDTWVLMREFAWPLLLFLLTVSGGGALYYRLAEIAGEPIGNPIKAAYHILGLTFLQPVVDFPHTWYLQLFYFLMPVVGIAILAQGVADFGVLLFNRRARGKEWEMAVASTFKDHIVLVGLGHLGFRVARHLREMDQDVVVIELDPNSDLIAGARSMDIPVITDDGTREIALEGAGIRSARALLVCTQNDSLNLQIALRARSLNPELHIVVRIFDDDFATSLEDQFGFRAFSSTGTAAPVFAAAAAGVDMTRPITVEGEALCLAHLQINSLSSLSGLNVEQVEAQYNVSVVLLRHGTDPANYHPPPDRMLSVGDAVAVLGSASDISVLAQKNNATG
jgi:Trk K+ transport system NAD-binding subunit